MTLTSPLLKKRAIKPGDEVITVAAGFPTTIAPIVQFGAIPVFVDVERDSANIDTTYLEQALSPKTKAIMLAHTLGNPFDLEKITAFCKKHNLWLIEDNCDALGSRFQGKMTGTFGDIGTSSFYPPHHLTTGEGGAVYTNDPLLAKIALSLRDWGRDCHCDSGRDNACGCRFNGQFGSLPFGYDHKYVYSHFGYNLKATEMQAAIGLAQLDKLPEFTRKRKENFAYLYSRLSGISALQLFETIEGADPSWFGFLMTIKENSGFDRNKFSTYLEENKIQTRNLFAGNLTRHPCFESLEENRDYRIAIPLTNTDVMMNNAVWIGVYPGMEKIHLDYMADTIIKFFEAE
jgi:CDP-6-deoxy-D-xylo-4-hexulose-3-dehydrase